MSTTNLTLQELAIENFEDNLKRIYKSSNYSSLQKNKIAFLIYTLRNIIEAHESAYNTHSDDPHADVKKISIHYEAARIYKLELIKAITEL